MPASAGIGTDLHVCLATGSLHNRHGATAAPAADCPGLNQEEIDAELV